MQSFNLFRYSKKNFLILWIKISCKIAPEDASESWAKQSSYSSRFWLKKYVLITSFVLGISLILGLKAWLFISEYLTSHPDSAYHKLQYFMQILGKGWWYSWYWQRWVRILLTLLKMFAVMFAELVVLLNVHEKYRVFFLGQPFFGSLGKCHWLLKTT